MSSGQCQFSVCGRSREEQGGDLGGVLVTFLIVVTDYLTERNLRPKSFILAHSLGVQTNHSNNMMAPGA